MYHIRNNFEIKRHKIYIQFWYLFLLTYFQYFKCLHSTNSNNTLFIHAYAQFSNTWAPGFNKIINNYKVKVERDTLRIFEFTWDIWCGVSEQLINVCPYIFLLQTFTFYSRCFYKMSAFGSQIQAWSKQDCKTLPPCGNVSLVVQIYLKQSDLKHILNKVILKFLCSSYHSWFMSLVAIATTRAAAMVNRGGQW